MRRLVAFLVPPILLATACGGSDTPAEGVSAVAAVYPLAWLAEEVAPEADVTLLNAGGLEAHDLELTPDQRRAIETSEVVLFVGDIDYQPQVEDVIASAEGEVVSLAEVAGPDRVLAPSEEAHADEEALAGEEAHAGEEEATVDAHLWFDAEAMADTAQRTGEAFAAADPDNAAAYRANADELTRRFSDFGESWKTCWGGRAATARPSSATRPTPTCSSPTGWANTE